MSHPEGRRVAARTRGSRLVGWALLVPGTVALLALCAACVTARPSVPRVASDTGNPYVDRQALRDDPSAALRMPGAEALQTVGAERRTTPSGYAPAFDGAIFGTPAASDEVEAFYASALAALGWQPDTYGVFPTSTDLTVRGWCKPDRLFRVAILDPASFTTTLNGARQYRTLFHATINGRPPDVACPSY